MEKKLYPYHLTA